MHCLAGIFMTKKNYPQSHTHTHKMPNKNGIEQIVSNRKTVEKKTKIKKPTKK